MTSRIAALERQFTRELMELTYKPVLADIADHWDRWVAEAEWPMDPVLKSIKLLEEAGLCVEAFGWLMDLLQRAAMKGRKPTPRQMLNNLLLA